MKPMTIGGFVLIAVGLLALIYQGITYTSHETIVDVGPIHASADRQKTLPISPLFGVVAAVAGVGLVFAGRRKTT
jgi:hypothetical protein